MVGEEAIDGIAERERGRFVAADEEDDALGDEFIFGQRVVLVPSGDQRRNQVTCRFVATFSDAGEQNTDRARGSYRVSVA